MAKKLQEIINLTNDTLNRFANVSTWTDFLKTAAWNYKYPFHDQALIYAQRPDATACVSITVWNNQLHRWVNKGSRGIALLHERQGNFYLDYVFNLSDTHGQTEIQLWNMREKDAPEVAESLQNTFGYSGQTDMSVHEAVFETVENAVDDNKGDYLDALNETVQESLLEGLDELSLEAMFTRLLANSVSYMILTRLGYDPNKHLEQADFAGIGEYNTTETLSVLGTAASDISEMALRSIEKTVKAIRRAEITDTKKFVKSEKGADNRDRKNLEGSEQDGRTDIPPGRGVSDTGYRNASGEANRQIRSDEKDVSKDSQTGGLLQLDPDREADRSSAGDRPDGAAAGGADHKTDGASAGNHRGIEGQRPNAVGRPHEQHQTRRRRKRDTGPYQQLSIFPTIAEQQQNIVEAEQITSAAFVLPQGDYAGWTTIYRMV